MINYHKSLLLKTYWLAPERYPHTINVGSLTSTQFLRNFQFPIRDFVSAESLSCVYLIPGSLCCDFNSLASNRSRHNITGYTRDFVSAEEDNDHLPIQFLDHFLWPRKMSLECDEYFRALLTG